MRAVQHRAAPRHAGPGRAELRVNVHASVTIKTPLIPLLRVPGGAASALAGTKQTSAGTARRLDAKRATRHRVISLSLLDR